MKNISRLLVYILVLFLLAGCGADYKSSESSSPSEVVDPSDAGGQIIGRLYRYKMDTGNGYEYILAGLDHHRGFVGTFGEAEPEAREWLDRGLNGGLAVAVDYEGEIDAAFPGSIHAVRINVIEGYDALVEDPITYDVDILHKLMSCGYVKLLDAQGLDPVLLMGSPSVWHKEPVQISWSKDGKTLTACYSVMREKKNKGGEEAVGIPVATWRLLDKDIDIDDDDDDDDEVEISQYHSVIRKVSGQTLCLDGNRYDYAFITGNNQVNVGTFGSGETIDLTDDEMLGLIRAQTGDTETDWIAVREVYQKAVNDNKPEEALEIAKKAMGSDEFLKKISKDIWIAGIDTE